MTFERIRFLRSDSVRRDSAAVRRLKYTRNSPLPLCFYHRSFELLQEGVALIDAQGFIRFANLSLARILESDLLDSRYPERAGLDRPDDHFADKDLASPCLAPDELVGEPIRRYIAPEFAENFTSLIDLLDYSDGSLGPFEMGLVRQDGKQLQVQATLGRMEYNKKVFCAVLVQDVTEWNDVKTTLEVAKFQLEQSYSATLEGWARTLELRDLETKGHSERVVKMIGELASRIGMTVDEMIHIRHGALMHDIGKIAIPDSILQKPGKLSADEWVEMKKHPTYARELLEKIEYLRPAMAIPYSHHEWWNGGGYPEGMIGQNIPLPARMFAVIDVYDALSNPRVYRPDVWEHDRIMSYLIENAEKMFDPDVVRLFASYM